MKEMKLSKLTANLSSLSISKLSEKIDEKKRQKEEIFNFTIGDFAPKNFAIPAALEAEIIAAYRKKYTNYPFVGGMPELRLAIANHLKLHGKFNYKPEEILVASGARPLIYLLFKTLVDRGEQVIYTAPSWNNQHYIYLTEATPIVVAASPENNFLITAQQLKPYLKKAALLTINSPLNPSGTIFSPHALKEILDLIVSENSKRLRNNQKPLYIFFDIIYWLLCYNQTKYINPITINPKIRDYVVFVDGISKCFAATGVRLGWAFGPQPIIDKMRSMLAHIGAWAPKPEQLGTAKYLKQQDKIASFLRQFRQGLLARLNIFYAAIQELKTAGYPVDAIAPQGAIYLSVKLDFLGAKTKKHKTLATVDDILSYLLDEAKIALVPFYIFGLEANLPWFRISVGTCSINEAKIAARKLKRAIKSLIV